MRAGRRQNVGRSFMGPVLGDLLPLAVGVAISPFPIIAVILAGRERRCEHGLLALAGTQDLGSSSDPSTASSWVKLVLGVLLLGLAWGQWRGRPEPGQQPAMPTWMSAIDGSTAVKAAGLGMLLSAVNPKDLLMCVTAGTTIAGVSLPTGQDIGSVAILRRGPPAPWRCRSSATPSPASGWPGRWNRCAAG
jgi:hypothetical protein